MAKHSIGGLGYTGPARAPARSWTDSLTALPLAELTEVRLYAINNAKHPAVLERETREAFAADRLTRVEAA